VLVGKASGKDGLDVDADGSSRRVAAADDGEAELAGSVVTAVEHRLEHARTRRRTVADDFRRRSRSLCTRITGGVSTHVDQPPR